jgi:hypothetical protein
VAAGLVDLPRYRPLGYELLVFDDEVATWQLDTLYFSLEAGGDPLAAQMKRSHITIKPRGGWQGYGDPAVRARG